MPQFTSTESIGLLKARDSVINIIKNDSYFKTLLKDAGDTDYISKFSSDVIVYRKPLLYSTVKKYPAISIFPKSESLSKEYGQIEANGILQIEIADQDRNNNNLIDDLFGYFQSLRITIEQYQSLCGTVDFFEFVNCVLTEPYKDNLYTQTVETEIKIKYRYI